MTALEQLLVRFSQLVVERPEIREIDINPLLASAEGILALDVRNDRCWLGRWAGSQGVTKGIHTKRSELAFIGLDIYWARHLSG